MKTIKTLFRVIASKTVAIPLFAILLSPVCSYADDTAALQALLVAGPVTLPAGHTYSVTGNLNVTYNFNLNGDVITMTAATGPVFRLRTAGITISNGTITGTWTPTSAFNGSGACAISIYGSNITVTNMTITNMPTYGIVAGGAYNNLVITHNTIKNVGYAGFYFDSETATTGGIFSNNTVDRSQIPPSAVHQLTVGIRGSTNSGTLATGWTITNNVISMPNLPTDNTAECLEVRFVTNSTISGNIFNNGSIGASLVRSSGITLTNNQINNSQLESVELADCTSCTAQGNTIIGSAGDGILLDGAVGSTLTQITSNVISGAKNSCIHAYMGTKNVTISGCTLTVNSGAKGINLQGTTAVVVQNTTFNGNGVGSLAVMLDTCPGNLTINGGAISNFTKCVVAISNSTAGLVTDNITMSGVAVSGVPNALSTYVANGGAVGKNIVVVNK